MGRGGGSTGGGRSSAPKRTGGGGGGRPSGGSRPSGGGGHSRGGGSSHRSPPARHNPPPHRSGPSHPPPHHSGPSHHPPPHHSGPPPHHSSGHVTISTPTTTVRSSDMDPRCLGGVFIAMGVVLVICAIFIPILMARGGEPEGCTPIDSINRREQVFCAADAVNDNWFAKFDQSDSGSKYAKVYRGDNTTIGTAVRTYSWLNFDGSQNYSWDYFSVASSLGIDATVTLRSNSTNRADLRVYWLDSQEYSGYEPSSSHKPLSFDFSDETAVLHLKAGPVCIKYLVFYCKDFAVDLEYDIKLDYLVYDTSKLVAEDITGLICDVRGLKKNELIIVDFPTTSDTATELDPGTLPEAFAVDLNKRVVNWSTFAVVLVLLLLFGALLLVVGFLTVYKYIKKAGKKFVDKVEGSSSAQSHDSSSSKSSSSSSSSSGKSDKMSTPMEPIPAATAQPVAAAGYDAGYPADQQQAYPGYAADPQAQAYSGQAYAAAPAYGADGQAYAVDPQAQAYPGQPYPGQPYPGQ